jgi:23S rRNA (guanosine2251-2'-O)-methyltransferase
MWYKKQMSSFETNNQIRQCLQPTCRFRFHAQFGDNWVEYCPKCGAPTKIIQISFPDYEQNPVSKIPVKKVEVLLDNIRSAYNIGSILRTADGAGVSHIYFCGISPTPDQPKVKKTSLGAEIAVKWSQHWNALDVVQDCRKKGIFLCALEGGNNSRSLFDPEFYPSEKHILLIIGNEVSGIGPEILGICNQTFWIPMNGFKRSLNVTVAFGIAVYFFSMYPIDPR